MVNKSEKELYNKIWKGNNPDKVRQYNRTYQLKHKEAIKKQRKVYREKNKEKIQKENKLFYEAHKERWREYAKRNPWRGNHPDYLKEYRKRYRAKNGKRNDKLQHLRRREDYQYRLNKSISTNIRASLLKTKNGNKWETLVGYTLQQLMVHLEKQFINGMSWGNYGHYWHIDHKVPKSFFNFQHPNDPDFVKCWALQNLQPLRARDNISKYNKYKFPFQPSLRLTKTEHLRVRELPWRKHDKA